MSHWITLPRAVAERPPWQRLVFGYGCAAVALPMADAAGSSNHGDPHLVVLYLATALTWVGILPLFLVITDLFRREYGPGQRALVSWISFGVSMGVVALAGICDRGLIPLFGALCGGGTWLTTGLVIQHHRANLPPPPSTDQVDSSRRTR